MKKAGAGLLNLGVGWAVGRFDGGVSRAEAVEAQGGGATSCAAKNGDGTVTDNCTGLTWQKESSDVNFDS